MSQLIVIDRANDDPENPLEIRLPEGTLALGHAAGLEWRRLPASLPIPTGARHPVEAEIEQAMLELPAIRQLKASARRKIEAEMGDFYELIADQSKQIEALTALVCRMAADTLGGTAMGADTKAAYLARVEMVVGALDSGQLVLRGDQEGPDNMLARVLARTSRINQIIGAEYLPRRDALLLSESPTPISVNSDPLARLAELNGVGNSLAQQIIDGRPWVALYELAEIGGISATMVDGWVSEGVVSL